MNGPTLYDFLKSHAKKGHTDIKLNLAPRKEWQFLNAGFSIQRLGPVKDYPQYHLCKVGWACPTKGTDAYRFFELAAAVYPELLEQAG